MHRNLLDPRSWNVRARSAAAAALVVTICLALSGGALLLVLYRTLENSARDAADARARQIVEELRTTAPDDLEGSLFATDGEIGTIQVVDAAGTVVAASPGAEDLPIVLDPVPPGESRYRGNIDLGEERDYWIDERGATSPSGTVTVAVGADREPIEDILATVALLLAVGGPVVVALVAVASYRLVGAALLPVERIRVRVATISTERLDERVPVPDSRDEIARLAATMNSMLGRLESGHRAQQRFVSDASHELRSPLATITAALELAHTRPELLDTALVDESLLPEARRMNHLLADLLLLARADEDGLTHATVDVDVDDLMYAERARLRDLSPELVVRTAIAPVRTTGDPQQLARMVRNLVDNARRHARREVELICRSSGGAAVVEVIDDGPGIAPPDRHRIFERFVRLDTPRTRDSGGAGLGLAIVAEIVATHGGTVEVTESDSGGARFVITLPLGGAAQSSPDLSR
ncbi:sensor histidine kinase [Rhodococcus sp. NPDC056960]|uniref:sensor histidine kinase n=1 Tax=Rhodococcus sp. NPDC056960 TaxID=3345982 RepID=UPI0036288097